MNAKQKAELQQITRRALKNVSERANATEETLEEARLSGLQEIPVQVTVGLGRATLSVQELLALKKGDVVTLDKQAGDPVDVFVNNHLVAQGELTLSGEQFGVVLTKIISA